jgi:hypothetical protein
MNIADHKHFLKQSYAKREFKFDTFVCHLAILEQRFDMGLNIINLEVNLIKNTFSVIHLI